MPVHQRPYLRGREVARLFLELIRRRAAIGEDLYGATTTAGQEKGLWRPIPEELTQDAMNNVPHIQRPIRQADIPGETLNTQRVRQPKAQHVQGIRTQVNPRVARWYPG